MKTTKLFFLGVSMSLFTVQTKAQLKVTTGGFVLAGASSPGTSWLPGTVKFQAAGTALFSTGLSSAPSSAAYIIGNNTWSTASNPDYTWYGDAGVGLFHPTGGGVIGFATNSTERMRLAWDGSLLIGATASTDAEKVRIDQGTNAFPTLETYNGNTSGGYAHIFRVAATATKCMAVFNSGTEEYYVAGDGRAWSKQGFSTYSDRSLKENIKPISKALDKILKLEGVTYNLIEEKNPNNKHIGLIAQDVEAIVPEVVATNDKGIKGIAYSDLIALLIESLKEQQKTIETQQNDIKNLKDNSQNLTQQMSYCCQAATAGITNSANTSSSIENTNPSTLYQNVPNPFSENTEIAYNVISTAQKSTLYLFDMQGTLIKTYDGLKAGNGKLTINGGELNPGMYLYSLLVDGKEVDTKRMILTK